MMIRAAPYWPASLPISSTTNPTFGIVELLDVLGVHRPRDLLVEVPRVGEEMDHDRLGEDLVLLALDRAGRRRRELDVVLVLLGRVLRLAGELLDDGEIHHLVERRLLRDRADLLVEEVGGVPGALEVGRVVLIEEELAVLGVVGRVRVAEHAERVALGNRIAGRPSAWRPSASRPAPSGPPSRRRCRGRALPSRRDCPSRSRRGRTTRRRSACWRSPS